MNDNISLNEKNPLALLPINKLLFRFSIPAVIAMVVNSIYNIVDQIFIQRSDAGTLGNAATTVAFPYITFTLALSLLIGNGGSALASIKLGEKKEKEANQILGNSLMLIVILSAVLIGLTTIFFEPLLKLLGASKEVMPYAKDYISIIMIGTLFMGIGSGMSGFIRADGAPKVSMFGLIIGCLLNVVLDPLFIYGLDMGVKGAALGTIISQILTASITIWYLIYKGKDLKIKKEGLILNIKLIKAFTTLGIASFVTQFANALVQICMNQSLRYYGDKTSVGGDTAMTAMGIVLKTNMLLIGFIVGIGTGAQPILGYNKGAGYGHRVKETYKKSVIVSVAVSTIGWLVFMFFPEAVMSIYGNKDPKLTEFACKALRIFMGLVCVAGFNIVSSNYFQAVGKSKEAFIMSLSRQILALIPLMLIMPLFMGLDGVLWAGFFADVIACTIAALMIWREFRNKSV